MKKIILILTLLIMCLPVFADIEPIILEKDIYEQGEQIIITGDSLSVDSLQIKVVNKSGEEMYNSGQIKVEDGMLNHKFYMPELTDEGTYDIHTSLGTTLSFRVIKKVNTATDGSSIDLNNYFVELEVGSEAEVSTFKFAFTLVDSNSSVTWSSSDDSIATVDEFGNVIAVGPGRVRISAKTTNGLTATAIVEVFLVGEEITPLGGINKPYMTGYPDGTFKPNGSITRAEMAVVYTKILGMDIDVKSQKFDDVTKAHWSYGYVNNIVTTGIFTGYNDGMFKPDQPITRGELAATFSKFWLYRNIDVDDSPVDLMDVKNHWASKHIFKLYNANIISLTDFIFKPDTPATRAQVVQMVNLLIERKPFETKDSHFDDVKDLDLIGDIEAATSLIDE